MNIAKTAKRITLTAIAAAMLVTTAGAFNQASAGVNFSIGFSFPHVHHGHHGHFRHHGYSKFDRCEDERYHYEWKLRVAKNRARKLRNFLKSEHNHIHNGDPSHKEIKRYHKAEIKLDKVKRNITRLRNKLHHLKRNCW